MAKSIGLAQKFWQGIYDLSGDVSAISSWSTPVQVLDITGIDSSAMERAQGLVSGSVSYNVFFNDAAGAAHVASRVRPGPSARLWEMPLGWLPPSQRITTGRVAQMARCRLISRR
jgi:hypothetical protein